MQERPYIPEEVKELLRPRPVIELHGLDGSHHRVAPMPFADRDGWTRPQPASARRAASQPLTGNRRDRRKRERQNRRSGRR